MHQPASSLRSGGTGLADSRGTRWDGRAATSSATGPTASDIEKFTVSPATEPIRAYAGLASAADTEARAALAVHDLERAGGFQRKNLLVVTTTGSGWVDPALVDTFEYLTGGDSAIVAMQYSYLPSWISYLVDQSKAREAGRDLSTRFTTAGRSCPRTTAPGCSCRARASASFGGETAFSGEHDLATAPTGTLFAGPPNFNTLFRSSATTATPAAPRSSPSTRTAGRPVRQRRDHGDPAARASPGTAPGCCT